MTQSPPPLRVKSRRILNRVTRTRRFRNAGKEILQVYAIHFKWGFLAFALFVFLISAYWIILKSPELYVGLTEKSYGKPMPIKEHLDSINSIRTTILSLFSGIALFVGAYLTLRNVSAAERNVKQAQEGQITDRFIKAIEKLGSDKLEMRLGGIYALERIARDSERDHWPVMEILTAFVRENGRWEPPQLSPGSKITEASKAATDIQAIMTVLGRRNWECERKDQCLDLSQTNMSGVDLTGAHLARAKFKGSRFDRTILTEVDFGDADLRDCELSTVEMQRGFLQDANLDAATLFESNLSEVVLAHATLNGSMIENVHLVGADMESASFLNATINQSDLGRSNLKYANFMQTAMNNVSFHKSHLEWAKFAGAYLVDTTLKESYTAELDDTEFTTTETARPASPTYASNIEMPQSSVQEIRHG